MKIYLSNIPPTHPVDVLTIGECYEADLVPTIYDHKLYNRHHHHMLLSVMIINGERLMLNIFIHKKSGENNR
jgi:hypothetical protein